MTATPVSPSIPTHDIDNNPAVAAWDQARQNRALDTSFNIPLRRIPHDSQAARRLLVVDENWW